MLSERLGICPGLSRKWRSIDWEPGLSGFSGCPLSSPAAIPAVLCTAKLQFPNCIETRVSFRLNTPLYMEPDASFQPYELPIPKRWLALLFPGWNIISICFSAILLTEHGSKLSLPWHITFKTVLQGREHPRWRGKTKKGQHFSCNELLSLFLN